MYFFRSTQNLQIWILLDFWTEGTGMFHRSDSVVSERAYSNSLSALPRRRGLKQQWHTELRSSVWEQRWHPTKLGNANEALERSIVRITSVSGKRKLGCIITNCFQIVFFSFRASYFTKIECRHWHHFSKIIVFPLKCRVSGHFWLWYMALILVKSPTSYLPSFFFFF